MTLRTPRLGKHVCALALCILAAAATVPTSTSAAENRPGALWMMKAWTDCATDRNRLCGEVPRGGGRIVRCLIDNEPRLQPQCQRHVATVTSVKDAWQTCRGDVESFCANILPGGGRIVSCLAGNRDRLSRACRDGFDDAADALRY